MKSILKLKPKIEIKKKDIFTIIFFVFFFGLTIFFSFTGGDTSGNQSNFFVVIASNLISFFRGGRELDSFELYALTYTIRKFIGHFLLFVFNGLLSYFFFLLFYERKLVLQISFIYCLCLAIISETLQYYAGGRSPTVGDALLDFLGSVLPLVLIILLPNHIKKVKAL